MIVIFVLALAIRLLHLWQISPSPFASTLLGDARAYDAWAQQIAGGDWMGRDVFYQAPLYPYLLGMIYAVAGRDLTIVRVLQAIGGATACLLLGVAGTRLFSRRAGLLAGFLLAIYPPAIFFDGLLQKSALDALLVCVVIWLVTRALDEPEHPVRWASLGLATGALCLSRENALVFVPVLLVWLARRWRMPGSRRWLAAIAFAVGVATFLVPVALRHAALGEGFLPTTAQLGPNFFIGNNPDATGTYRPLRPGRGSAEFERIDATMLAERAVGRRLTPGEVSRHWMARGTAFIIDSPGTWLRLLGRKLGLLVNRVEVVDTDSQESYAEWSTWLRVVGPALHFGVLLPLAVLGLWTTWARAPASRLLPAMAGVYAVSVLAFYVVARYRYPLAPFVILWAAAGLLALPSFLRAPFAPAHGAGALVGAIVAVAAAANWPVVSHAEMQAVTENALGAALLADGRSVESVAHFQRAIALAPEDALAHVNLGSGLQAAGRGEEARVAFARAAALRPDLGDARYFLGKSLADAGRTAEAIPHLQAAAGALPDEIDVRTSLGLALAAEDRLDAAIAEFREVVRRDPARAVARWNLGSALAATGRYRDAIPELQEATRLDPSNARARQDLADAHNRLGITFAAAGAMAEAIVEFETALRVEPGFADATRNLDTARAKR